jgi:hypothetical protein
LKSLAKIFEEHRNSYELRGLRRSHSLDKPENDAVGGLCFALS